MSLTRVLSGVAVVFAIVGLGHSATIVEDFSTDPAARGWTGVGNTTAPNNYGWSAGTNNAGGAVGEAGGTFQARLGAGGIRGYWDSTLGGSLTQSQALSATGIFSVSDLALNGAFDGGFEFGFLNVTSPTAVSSTSGGHSGGYTPMIGFRINDDNPLTSVYRVNAHMAFGTTNTTQRVQSGLLSLTAGVDYKFTITYDPNGGGAGSGITTVDFNLASDDSPVGSLSTPAISSTGPAVAFDAFGFSGLTYAANNTTANIFVDNLEYTAVPEPHGFVLASLGVFGAIGCWSRRLRTAAKVKS